MGTRLRGFACSWLFAPYVGSADVDLWKRLKDTPFDFTVVQVRRDRADPALLAVPTRAGITRIEVETSDHRAPRTRRVRDQYEAGVLRAWARAGPHDFLLSHSNEVPSHAAALRLKRRHPRIPWVAYFGDLVAANPYVRYVQPYPLQDEDAATEAATIAEADAIVVNNPYQRDLMFRGAAARHLRKAVVVPHCFDPGLYPPAAPRGPGPFRLAHLGTLYGAKRTAAPLLRAVDRLVEIYPAYRDRLEVAFLGGTPCADDQVAYAAMRCRERVRFEGPVTYLESLRRMREADALVLLDGLFSEAEDGLSVNPFLACKLVDYLGAGRPVIGVTMARGASADLLRETGNPISDARPDRLAHVLKRCVDGKVRPRLDGLDRLSCAAVARSMERVIRSIVRPAAEAAPAVDAPSAA